MISTTPSSSQTVLDKCKSIRLSDAGKDCVKHLTKTLMKAKDNAAAVDKAICFGIMSDGTPASLELIRGLLVETAVLLESLTEASKLAKSLS